MHVGPHVHALLDVCDSGTGTGLLESNAKAERASECPPWRRYDVEMFQKVEALTGLRMDKYECEADAALLLLERTTEAQQMAAMQARPGNSNATVICQEAMSD